MPEHLSDLWKAIKDDQPVKAVVMDTDFNLTSAKLIRAELYLKNPDCILIVGATDSVLPILKTTRIMGK